MWRFFSFLDLSRWVRAKTKAGAFSLAGQVPDAFDPPSLFDQRLQAGERKLIGGTVISHGSGNQETGPPMMNAL